MRTVQRGLQSPEPSWTGAFQRRQWGSPPGLPEPEPLDAQFSDRRQLQIPRNVRANGCEGGPQQLRDRTAEAADRLAGTQARVAYCIEDTNSPPADARQRTGTDARVASGTSTNARPSASRTSRRCRENGSGPSSEPI
ncbi:MAG: hypothetical protein ACLSHC_15160 [Bilophila wadsworthia]